MCRPWTRLALVSAAALILASLPAAALAAPLGADAPITLDPYNLTDVHGHVQQVAKKGIVREAGLPAMDCYLKKACQADLSSSFTLLGDNIGASPRISDALRDNPTIAALDMMNPLASTVGNHELDMGQTAFKQHVDGSNPDESVQATFPYLGVNIEDMGTYEGGTPYLEDYKLWMSSSDMKVVFIDAIAQDVPYELSPGTTAGLTFMDPIKRTNDLAAELKDSGKADVVVAMLDDDVRNNYPKIGRDMDGLMGGNTCAPYEFDHVNSHERFSSANPLLAGIASGFYTDNLGLIHLTIDPVACQVTSTDSTLVPAAEVTQYGSDPDTQAIVDQAESDSKEAGKRVVAAGYTEAFRRGIFTAPGEATDPGSNRDIEFSLGGLVVSSLHETTLAPDGKGVDIGMIMADGLRTDLVPNEDDTITYAQTCEVMPFSDELGYITSRESNVKDVLEQRWRTDLNSQNSRPMLELGLSSNVRYTYDPAKPYSQRIASVAINDEPLRADTTYTIDSVPFLLEGGDSSEALTHGRAATTNGNLGRDFFNTYLGAYSGGRARSVRAERRLSSREAKSSVGLTLPAGAVADSSAMTTPLRSLSFSEGPSIILEVRVSARGAQTTTEIGSSPVNAYAPGAASIITTDDAGQASVDMTIVGACEGKAAGEIMNVPVTVATDFATAVEAGNGLTTPVTYIGDDAARPSPTPSAGGDAAPSAPTPSASPSPSAKRGGLARTGACAEVLPGAAAIAAISGAGVLARRRANRYQSEN